MRDTLTKQEWIIMEVLWERSPLFFSELAAALRPKVTWAQSTLATYLKRMQSSGYVEYETVRGSRSYRPAVSREECMAQESRSLMSRMTDSSKKVFLTNMILEGDLPEQDYADLRELIEKMEKRSRPHQAGGEDT